MTEEEFLALIKSPEGKNLEFKSAQHTFSENTALVDYCAAIANEGGGKLILGVSNTRKVIGSIAFKGTINKVLMNLYQKLKLLQHLVHLLFALLGLKLSLPYLIKTEKTLKAACSGAALHRTLRDKVQNSELMASMW